MKIDLHNKTLLIREIADSDFSFDSMKKYYEDIENSVIKAKPSALSIDLDKAASDNYSLLAFIISLAELAVKNTLKIDFINLKDEKLKDKLNGLGFRDKGKYKPASYREEIHESLTVILGTQILSTYRNFKKFIGFLGEVVISIFYCIRHPGKLSTKEITYYMEKSGADAIGIVCLICFLVGLIIAFQGIAQMARFGLSVYVADLVSVGMVREMGPLMVAVICIGRAGSAYAAELGTMNSAEEIDAMITMGLKPARTLVLPKIIALACVVPMLVMIGDLAGIIGGATISLPLGNFTLIQYWNRTVSSLIPANLLESLIKGLVFGIIIAIVGCYRGMEAEKDAKGVGSATTSSVVTSIFFIILADFFITLTLPLLLGLFGISY